MLSPRVIGELARRGFARSLVRILREGVRERAPHLPRLIAVGPAHPPLRVPHKTAEAKHLDGHCGAVGV